MQTLNCIAKENIPQYTFAMGDVLRNDAEGRVRRYSNLMRAQTLGNGLKNKVNIIFQTSNGQLQEVVTTVWGASEDYVSLKGGIVLPVRAISRVDL